jgi:2-dehydro-3-deoxygluconokinase
VSAPAPRALCIGEALAVLVPTTPGPLESAELFRRGVGGAELNVAFALAAEGVPAALLSRVGDDGFGRHIVATAAAAGVDVSAVAVDPERATGLYVKELGGGGGGDHDLPAGASRMHYFRRDSAGSALSAGDLATPTAAALLAAAELVHLTGITPALSDGAERLALGIRDSLRPGALLAFDVNWRPRLWRGREEHGARVLRAIAERADVVLLGGEEATVLTGTADPDAIRAALPGPRWLVVKGDAAEATAFDGDRSERLAPEPTTVTELIGAGDAFAGGFLAAVLGGADAAAALRRAHASAARAIGSVWDHVAPIR